MTDAQRRSAVEQVMAQADAVHPKIRMLLQVIKRMFSSMDDGFIAVALVQGEMLHHVEFCRDPEHLLTDCELAADIATAWQDFLRVTCNKYDIIDHSDGN